MPDALRTFVVRTILEDLVSGRLERIVDKAQGLTEKAYTITVDVATKEAEKAIANVEKATKQAASADHSKATKGLKEQSQATGGLADKMTAMAEQSQKAGNTVGGFFSKLDAGRLIVGAAAAGMIAYAKAALQVAESHRLNIDMIRDQLGAQSVAALSFIQAGDQGKGTSSLTRGNLAGYMAMTGYTDEKVIEKNIKNAERIMSSKFGQSLAGFGINDEKGLMQTLSNPIQETSDIGRIVKSKMPEFFKAGTLQNMNQEVRRDSKFAYQSDDVVEAEARRRLASKAMEKIAGQVEPDSDSYRVGMRDFTNSFAKLNEGIGNAVRPAAAIILTLMTAVNRLLALAPEVPVLIAVVLGLGTAFAAFGAIMPMVTAGVHAFSASLLANPIGIAIVAIVALVVILSALENRFGLVTKAWDKFAKSEIGKDLIEGVKSLLDYLGLLGEGDLLSGLGAGIERIAGFVGGLFDQVDAVYKMLKGGDLGGALKGGLGLMLKLSPIGMVAGFSEALLPSKRVQDMILYVLQKMKDLWDGFTRWLSDIWDSIKALLDPLFKIRDFIKNLVETFLGKEGPKTSAETEKAFREAIESDKSDPKTGKIGLADGLKPEDKDWLVKNLVGGEAAPFGKTQTDTSISDYQYATAKKMLDDIKNPKGLLNGGAGNVINYDQSAPDWMKDADKSFNEYGAGKEAGLQDKIEKKDAWGYAGEVLGGYYDILTGKAFTKNALGGEVTKSGMAWVDEGEPIVPAEVSRSSVLIDRLKEIASGSGGGQGGANLINVYVTAAPGQDGYNLGRQIAEEIDKRLTDFEFKQRQEAIHNRANRAFIA